MRIRLWKICCMVGLIFVTTGCMGNVKSSAHEEITLSAWTAYWDMDQGMREYRQIQGHMSKLSYFAAYFNAQDQLFVPAEVQTAKERAGKKNTGTAAYLTIVNDYKASAGKTTEKDLAVLRRVLADDEAVDRHVAEILALARQGGYDGIEIDYEKVWKDKALFQRYMDFIYRLSAAAIHDELKLRVILEPSVPMDAPFCRGPEYVVMFYNLYGTHSGPGPKADEAFILKTIKRMEKLPGKKAAAFSTGGCLWERSGPLGIVSGPTKRFIDEQTAMELQKKHSSELKRDGDSAALYFDYEEQGKKYTVWYADQETLNAWITIAAENGITDISLWRLGGNQDIRDVR